jgi:hypothetical protein
MRLRASITLTATVVATMAVYAPPAIATNPVCADPIPRELCGGRVFAEPMQSVSGLTYRQAVQGMQQLALDHPEWITFDEFGDGSADGNTLYYAEVTAPYDVTGENGSVVPLAERKIVLANQSIHGNEPGGREGGTRYLEDLVNGTDPERTQLLDRVRLIQTFINPDGWAAGDHDHVQTGGGAYLWARQNGDGPISGASDVGFGTDLNRQAPWRGISHDVTPLRADESIAFHDFVNQLAADGDIQASVDIHGEVTEAAAWVMQSSGQFDLKGAMNQRYQGEHLFGAIEAALEDSVAKDIVEFFGGDVASTILTASSEFGSVSSESTASGTGFQGDWMAQPEGGDSASLSTIELYNFFVSPGVNSLTARKEVMQYYRDTVAGILGGLIDQAAVEHNTMLAAGSVAWVDDAPDVMDPIREVTVSSSDFFRDLAPLSTGGLVAVTADSISEGAIADADSVIITTAGLLSSLDDLAALRTYVEFGGNVVLTDAAMRLLPGLVNGITAGDITMRTDDGGKVSYDRTHTLAKGIRDIAWMNTETATMGLQVTGSGNVPTWLVDTDVWEAAGGTTAGVSGGETSVGEVTVGDGTVRTIGVLLPSPDGSSSRISYGINGYGVLDTGYIVLANALDGELEHEVRSSVPGAPVVGWMDIADVTRSPAPAPAQPGAVPAALVLALGLAVTARVARKA